MNVSRNVTNNKNEKNTLADLDKDIYRYLHKIKYI